MKLKRIISVLLSLLLSLSIACSATAHSGRTDSSGGHRDNKNKSGLGSYHYHHGYGAHLHPGGVCPYSSGATTPASGGTTTVATDNSNYFIYSDIVATINEVKIPSLNYDNATYIKADDLAYYSFDVVFDSSAKTLTISRNSSKQVQGVEYVSGEKSTKANKIVDSSIEVYLKVGSESVKVGAYNSNDYMYMKFGELSKYGTMTWDDVNRVSALKLE